MDINSQAHINAIAPVISKAYKLGKEHKHDEAYQVLLPHFEAKEIPSFFEKPCGWTIYHYLKKNEDKLSSRDIRKALVFYMTFASCKPSALHSCMMIQAANLLLLHCSKMWCFQSRKVLMLFQLRNLLQCLCNSILCQ